MMRILGISVFLIILIFTIPQSFAQEDQILVSIPAGTSTPDCENADLCYIPSPLTVKVGDVVTWTNNDSVDHTVTSGSPEDGPDGIIFSDLITPGNGYAFSFNKPGSYTYYCTLHLWMEGVVIVEVAKAEIETEYDLTEKRITSDGSIMIEIQTNTPKAREVLPLEIKFTDENDNLLIHMNYAIKVTQDNKEFLFIENAHAMDGTTEHMTRALLSDDPIDIDIGIRGIYPEDATQQPVEEIIQFLKVIPEFGTIAMMILGISIASIIIFTRVKLIPNVASKMSN